MGHWWPPEAVGPITAAAIAALISLCGLIIAKEHKISELRQAWIDALRNDLSLLIAHVHAIRTALSLTETATFSPLSNRWHLCGTHYLEAKKTVSLVLLRLNPSKHAQLAALVRELDSQLNLALELNFNVINTLETQIVDEAQKVLKSVWERVKQGELFYKSVRLLLFVFLSICVLLITVDFSLFISKRLVGTDNAPASAAAPNLPAVSGRAAP